MPLVRCKQTKNTGFGGTHPQERVIDLLLEDTNILPHFTEKVDPETPLYDWRPVIQEEG